jgi:hypothetical protein
MSASSAETRQVYGWSTTGMDWEAQLSADKEQYYLSASHFKPKFFSGTGGPFLQFQPIFSPLT